MAPKFISADDHPTPPQKNIATSKKMNTNPPITARRVSAVDVDGRDLGGRCHIIFHIAHEDPIADQIILGVHVAIIDEPQV